MTAVEQYTQNNNSFMQYLYERVEDSYYQNINRKLFRQTLLNKMPALRFTIDV